jgi:hypothetical protein
LLGVLSSGCTIDCYERGECECAEASHCGEGNYCVNGTCRELVETPWIVATRGFADSCVTAGQCKSGYCLPQGPGNGGVCTQRCEAQDCPEGWQCKTWLSDSSLGPRAVCVQETVEQLCESCNVDAHCNAVGDLCLELDNEFVCARDCSREACPSGYACEDVETVYGVARQCIPEGRSCDCAEATLGLTRSCDVANEYGRCFGRHQCAAGEFGPEWGPCDAEEPRSELCNGMDDDCDGLQDDLDPSIDVSELPADPPYPFCIESGCAGRWSCGANEDGTAYGWHCDATDPERELCNAQDDNCDGQIDEPFVDELGRYVSVEHCGACQVDCRELVPRLARDEEGAVLEDAVTCALRDEAPICVPLRCEAGFYPFPELRPVTCARLLSPVCQPCAADSDCGTSWDWCAQFADDPGMHCVQSCAADSPYENCTGATGMQDCCPDGYLCSATDRGPACVPLGETCTCNALREGVSRSCIAEGPMGICQGEQLCTLQAPLDFEWSACEPSAVVVEVCDGQDNNCNGEIDEDFVDEFGRYVTDEHCGECNMNCPSRYNPEKLHAMGACVDEGGELACRFVGCTEESWGAGGVCRADEDCELGLVCDPVAHFCVDAACHEASCGPSCTSNTDCQSRFGAAHKCEQGHCVVALRFHNPNELVADGCECAQAIGDAIDEPDLFDAYPPPGQNYLDRDCDGVDGEIARSLFVSSDSLSSQGTLQNPYRTIGEAMAAFDPARHVAILVAAGRYRENVVLRSGVRLYGGYALDFSKRDVALYPTWVLGNEPDQGAGGLPGTISVDAVSARTILSGFMVQGYDVNADPAAGQAAPSSYAIYVRNCDQRLELYNNLIIGGRGGDGPDGTVGKAGENGGAGGRGLDSWECPTADCAGLTRSGGTGGNNASCSASAGRAGAMARDWNYGQQDYPGFGKDGEGGVNNTYQHSDPSQYELCKYDCSVGSSDTLSSNGGAAQAGDEGSAGAPGIACSNAFGSVSNGLWSPSAASAGTRGSDGDGGGGGGAGGAVVNNNVWTGCTIGLPNGDLGASGGGGGAGGCGATGGGRGGAGGGSFGIFLFVDTSLSSWPKLQGNRIRRGFGGDGGEGGGGGQGGLGGQGGAGGLIVQPAWCAGAGGAGGRGGDGGAGGGGGGGCGGVSFGIAGVGLPSQVYSSSNRFETPGVVESGGSGGQGGPSPAGPSFSGETGSQGASGDVHAF